MARAPALKAKTNRKPADRYAAYPAPPDLTEGREYSPRHIELLDGLEAIIVTEGFRDLTVGALAEQLQCSRRTLYEIAESKEQIVLVVVDRMLRRVARRAHAALAAETELLSRLRAYLTQGLVEVRRTTVSFAEDVADAPAVHNLVVAHFRYAYGVTATLLAEGIATGQFVDINPLLAAEMLDAGLTRLQDPAVLRATGIGWSQGMEEFLDVFVSGLRRSAR